jgi:hypothetical protein
MLTKIYFPIVNTSNVDFETDYNLSVEEYNQMFVQHFQENEASMQNFVNNRFDNRNNYSAYSNRDIVRDVNDFITYSEEIETFITLQNNNNPTDEDFKNIIESGKMSILTLNINPSYLDYDLGCEIKSWIGESDRINGDRLLDNKTKLAYLPSRNIKVDLSNNEQVILNNCKVLKNESDKNFPFKVIIIVENIKYN